MKKIILCSFVLGLIYVFGALEAKAQIPPGSYTLSCQIISVNSANGTLTAVCNSKSGKTKINRDFKYKYCLGDISNQDGYLSCAKDQAKMSADAKAADEKAAAEKAKKDAEKDAEQNAAAKEWEKAKIAKFKSAFDTAALLVLGRETSDLEVSIWLKNMQKQSPGQFETEVKFTDVVKYLKTLIAQPLSSTLRTGAINNAFREVYGIDALPVQQAQYDAQIRAQQATYSSIVLTEIKNLNEDKIARKLMIARAYKKSMGRVTVQSEMDYWLPRADHFRQIVEASRSWLYSANGSKDLAETVKRALEVNKMPGENISNAKISDAMKKFTVKKLIFDEMTN